MLFTQLFLSAAGLLSLVAVSAGLPSREDAGIESHRPHSTYRPPPTKSRGRKCKNPAIRKEWRTLSTDQQDEFLRSVNCLIGSPGALQALASGVRTRWDDFVYTHQIFMPMVHNAGQFLPWHRLYLYEYERVLRSECGYSGYLPWWDAKQDGHDIFTSPMWSATHGFGGNGAYDPTAVIQFLNITADGGGCLVDGPFKDTVIHVGYTNDTSYQERCIKRNIIRFPASRWFTPAAEQDALASQDYERFAVVLEGDGDPNTNLGMHNTGHMSVGGDMMDPWVSPGDPIFFPHHANIDRIWAQWQKQSEENQWDMGNPIAPRAPFQIPLWPDAPPGNVTLDYRLGLGALAGPRLEVEVGQVMHTRGKSLPGRPPGFLCYEYA